MLARKPSNAALVNVTPNFVHVARLGRPDDRPLSVDAMAEIALDDELGLASWIRREFREETRWITGYCGFHPKSRVLVRDTLIPRRLDEPGYLAGIVSTLARVDAQRDWQLAALEADSGRAFTSEGTPRAGLIVGVAKAEVRTFQQSLIALNIRPRRLEVGTLAALGSAASLHAQSGSDQALAICEIEADETRIYILARNGLHTQPVLPCGLRTIEEAAMKEFGCADLTTARRRLDLHDEELQRHERRLMRLFARHLRLSFDYFEHQTGQVIGAMQCCHLPASRGWVARSLAAAVDVSTTEPDVLAWANRTGLELTTPPPSSAWLASLGLVADLTPPVADHAPAS